MFKSFTDNISSFIGNTSNSSSSSTNNNSSSSSGDAQPSTVEAGATEQRQKVEEGENAAAVEEARLELGTAEAKNNSDGTANEDSSEPLKTSKVPPPRPNPPLSAAASINKEADDRQHDDNALDASSNENSNQEAGDETEKKGDKLDEVAEKAKAWGSYLFSVTKSAGATVGAKAMELKKVVAENTILGDFVKEQDKFVSAKKEKARANEAAVPPWVGYNEEEQMKTQMFNLSADKRNFLRNPPTGVQFHFDYETCYPVAMATLAEDPRLQEMRFKLVPKNVSEHDFWRNYFYRVSLIKQSTQLTSLAKQSSSSAANVEASPQSTQNKQESQLSAEEKPTAVSEPAASADVNDGGNDDADASGANDEFISDAYNLEISDEDLMKEMEALRASPSGDDEWEEELQKELTDFEVVGGEGNVDDAELEKAILSEMSSSDLK